MKGRNPAFEEMSPPRPGTAGGMWGRNIQVEGFGRGNRRGAVATIQQQVKSRVKYQCFCCDALFFRWGKCEWHLFSEHNDDYTAAIGYNIKELCLIGPGRVFRGANERRVEVQGADEDGEDAEDEDEGALHVRGDYENLIDTVSERTVEIYTALTSLYKEQGSKGADETVVLRMLDDVKTMLLLGPNRPALSDEERGGLGLFVFKRLSNSDLVEPTR